jgi:hypothetical protein
MKTLSTSTSERFSVALATLEFGRMHGSFTALHRPCCEHFVADAAWSTSPPPAEEPRVAPATLTS